MHFMCSRLNLTTLSQPPQPPSTVRWYVPSTWTNYVRSLYYTCLAIVRYGSALRPDVTRAGAFPCLFVLEKMSPIRDMERRSRGTAYFEQFSRGTPMEEIFASLRFVILRPLGEKRKLLMMKTMIRVSLCGDLLIAVEKWLMKTLCQPSLPAMPESKCRESSRAFSRMF